MRIPRIERDAIVSVKAVDGGLASSGDGHDPAGLDKPSRTTKRGMRDLAATCEEFS